MIEVGIYKLLKRVERKHKKVNRLNIGQRNIRTIFKASRLEIKIITPGFNEM